MSDHTKDLCELNKAIVIMKSNNEILKKLELSSEELTALSALKIHCDMASNRINTESAQQQHVNFSVSVNCHDLLAIRKIIHKLGLLIPKIEVPSFN